MSKQSVCNKCGKVLDLWDKQENFHMSKELGYGTKYDGSTLELDLCCSCMDELIEACTLTPIIEKN